jgi:hypothetical protein
MAAPIILVFVALAAVAPAEVQQGRLVAPGNGGIAMTDMYGENMRSCLVSPTARIMRDGNHVKLEDLKLGDHVIVTTRQQDRQNKVVIRIDAHSAG